MPTCWVTGCRSGYRGRSAKSSNTDVKRHLFKVPADKIDLWKRRIPRVGELTTKHSVCDIHFEDRFILKTFKHIIDGQTVEMEREKWKLSPDAEPTIFPNLPQYLSHKLPKPRQRKQRMQPVASSTPMMIDDPETNEPEPINSVLDSSAIEKSKLTAEKTEETVRRNKWTASEMYLKNRTIRRQKLKIEQLKLKIKKITVENKKLLQKVAEYENLSPKMKLVISEAQNSYSKSNTGNRYSTDWILDAILIRCKSTSTYNMLRANGLLPLPSITTLNRSIKSMRPDFGFDKALFAGLKLKLEEFPRKERRGILMFDEIQVKKNVDFRVETGKLVGMVDFGDLTTPENMFQEGDHALVFLFHPHMGGWMQTIGCFCAAGTTPTVVLSKLILQAIILLENAGAEVDALVSDGASTNRAALASFGLCGEIEKTCNSMKNPCDDSRSVFFICDVPHLLKTVRNNLLKAKEFEVSSIY